jgi:hypothetical protein
VRAAREEKDSKTASAGFGEPGNAAGNRQRDRRNPRSAPYVVETYGLAQIGQAPLRHPTSRCQPKPSPPPRTAKTIVRITR